MVQSDGSRAVQVRVPEAVIEVFHAKFGVNLARRIENGLFVVVFEPWCRHKNQNTDINSSLSGQGLMRSTTTIDFVPSVFWRGAQGHLVGPGIMPVSTSGALITKLLKFAPFRMCHVTCKHTRCGSEGLREFNFILVGEQVSPLVVPTLQFRAHVVVQRHQGSVGKRCAEMDHLFHQYAHLMWFWQAYLRSVN